MRGAPEGFVAVFCFLVVVGDLSSEQCAFFEARAKPHMKNRVRVKGLVEHLSVPLCDLGTSCLLG